MCLLVTYSPSVSHSSRERRGEEGEEGERSGFGKAYKFLVDRSVELEKVYRTLAAEGIKPGKGEDAYSHLQ